MASSSSWRLWGLSLYAVIPPAPLGESQNAWGQENVAVKRLKSLSSKTTWNPPGICTATVLLEVWHHELPLHLQLHNGAMKNRTTLVIYFLWNMKMCIGTFNTICKRQQKINTERITMKSKASNMSQISTKWHNNWITRHVEVRVTHSNDFNITLSNLIHIYIYIYATYLNSSLWKSMRDALSKFSHYYMDQNSDSSALSWTS
jgi:hypothetical protein